MNSLPFRILALLLLYSAPAWCAPLPLKECLQMARTGSPVLKGVSWERSIAEQGRRQMEAAGYPRVDAHAGYTVQLEPQAVKIGGATAETQEANFASAGISATYILYDFGRRSSRISQAAAYTEAAAENYENSRSDVSLQVIDAYFRILEAEQLITAAKEEVSQITEHRRIAQVLFEEGVVTRNDVLQADVRLASARQKLLGITNRRENAWLQLNFLTGSAAEFRGELDPGAVIDEPAVQVSPDGIPAGRHDIASLRRGLEARGFEVQEHRDSYLPEIYTRIGIDYVQNDKVREQAIYGATLGIRLSLFDGHASQSARERAVGLRSRQQDMIRMAEQRAQLEIATARNDAAVARERIAVSATAIRQSEENLRINRERYQERVGIASEVLDAQTLLTMTRTEHSRAMFDYQTALARLQHALGML